MSSYRKTHRKEIIIGVITLTTIAVFATAIFVAPRLSHKEARILDIPKPRNIVVINIDSLRADHMGVYGYKDNTTPFLDSLMKQGTVFENAETPGILTFQSDAALFSGLYPSENNVIQWTTPINKSLTLLPSILGMYGYNTAGFVSPSLWERFGWSASFHYYKISNKTKNIEYSKKDVEDYLKKSTGPTFVFWHIYDAHVPYIYHTHMTPDTKYNSIFDDVTKQRNFIWEGQSTSSIELYLSTSTRETVGHELTEGDRKYLKEAYDDGVRYIDDQLRSFFESIKNEPWYKDTLFVISSEHGDDLNEHGYFFHRDLYEVNTHVPLAIIYPPYIPSARIVEPVNTMDLTPTLIALAKGIEPAHTGGSNLIPLMSGNSTGRDVFIERPPFNEYAIRRGSWKYIMRNPDIREGLSWYDNWMKRLISHEEMHTRDELYNLATDPSEQYNLIGTGLPIENELRSTLFGFKKDMLQARELNKDVPNITPQGGSLIPYP